VSVRDSNKSCRSGSADWRIHSPHITANYHSKRQSIWTQHINNLIRFYIISRKIHAKVLSRCGDQLRSVELISNFKTLRLVACHTDKAMTCYEQITNKISGISHRYFVKICMRLENITWQTYAPEKLLYFDKTRKITKKTQTTVDTPTAIYEVRSTDL